MYVQRVESKFYAVMITAVLLDGSLEFRILLQCVRRTIASGCSGLFESVSMSPFLGMESKGKVFYRVVVLDYARTFWFYGCYK